MFCPQCKDEFRPGFDRCGRCNVDLVHELDAAAPSPAAQTAATPVQTFLRMADFCGFLSLDEARAAREELREHQVRTEILIREVPTDDTGARLEEEYWLRVEATKARLVAGVLGIPAGGDTPQVDEEAGFQCGDCGHHVADEEKFCPGCGARFEDD
jgi:hypothetical protein